MNKTWQSALPRFDPYSYYAGMTYAFTEIVAAGVKPLALSPPYTPAEAEVMARPTELIAQKYGIVTYTEPDLLVTNLFPAAVAKGKVVILLANAQQTLDSYLGLKRQRAAAGSDRYDPEFEIGLATAFGRLLSYSDEAIAAMLAAKTAPHDEGAA